MNREWLMENADAPIKYSLTGDSAYIEPMLENEEVKAWLGRLSDRALCGDLSDIHGSHDYRWENIAGKCFVLGLDTNVPPFDAAMRFFIDFLGRHMQEPRGGPLTFGKMYHYRDYETILACYMPFLGYAHEKSVQYVASKRANIVCEFTRQGRYDVYRDDLAYPGANKAWKPYILDPELYRDGNIALPSIHDLILFAGMYPHFDHETREKVETTVRWLFGGGYASIHDRLYYYTPDDPNYKSKAINSKVRLPDLRELSRADAGDLQGLLYLCFILSHFREAREWVSEAVLCLERYKTESGRYVFPKEMIAEKKDSYATDGGHMNPGESKKNKRYAEIVSTYWMERICANLNRG